jgi:hypothetical protein
MEHHSHLPPKHGARHRTRSCEKHDFQCTEKKLNPCEEKGTNKAELFTFKFTNIVPAAALKATLTISNLQDYNTTVFTFSNIKLVDSNFSTLPIVNGA